jgi:uncharacterized iron-regulated membrane protein
MRVRAVVFWVHLSAAVAAGGIVLILCLTGATLVFARQIQEWSERGVRRPGAPAAASVRLTLDEALLRAKRAQPAWPFMEATLFADPKYAFALSTEDHRTLFVNAYTGQVQVEPEPAFQRFFQVAGLLHTRLNLDAGQPFAAAANVVFLVLACSGLCLWWPHAWRWAAVRPSIWFVKGASGRAREWNWHNVVAIWFLPALIVLAGTGVVLSYRSVNAEMFRLAPIFMKPAASNQRSTASPAVQPAARLSIPSTLDSFAARVAAGVPGWESIYINFYPPQGGSVTGAGGAPFKGFEAVVIRAAAWPPFATTLASLDPATGALRLGDTYASAPPGRRARMWVRTLHSGDAFGNPGRIIACLTCLAGCLLVYTGYAMVLRRLARRLRGA